MPTYPQLATGSVSQYPVQRQRRMRTVWNRSSDGSSIRLADPTGAATLWRLHYRGLTDEELTRLEQFLIEAEGSLNGFTFVDPTANLLEQSGDLSASAWVKDPLLSVGPGIQDPWGGGAAWRLTNSAPASQSIVQTLAAPTEYVYCVSAYVRSNAPSELTLLAGAARATRSVNSAWNRIQLTAPAAATGNGIPFGLEIPAGASMELFGPQAEAQARASAYKQNSAGGVYPNARLRDDYLEIVSTGVNRHSCTVNIIHANHL